MTAGIEGWLGEDTCTKSLGVGIVNRVTEILNIYR